MKPLRVLRWEVVRGPARPVLPQEPAIGAQRLWGLAGVDNSTGIHQRCEGNVLGSRPVRARAGLCPTRLDRGSR